ncbi:MAG: hypothetical protein ACKO03_08990 [Bacteroidota bacterium]
MADQVKSLKAYVYEGLMIFFAVSLGFIAENIRDTVAERNKERVLMESIVTNLKIDTAALNIVIEGNIKKNRVFDSLIVLANQNLNDTLIRKQFYGFFIAGTYMSLFLPSDAALVQIKTDGGLGLISKKGVADSILNYDKGNESLLRHNQVYTEESDDLWEAGFTILELRITKDLKYVDFFNGRKMTGLLPPPIVTDPDKLKVFFGRLTRCLLLTQTNRNMMIRHRQRAENLIQYLTDTYGLEN